MKRAKTAPPEELLAAYADGGVTDEERAVVEQYLDENPHAREELDAIRELVVRTRAAVPRPVEEPEWSTMARRIIAMCDRDEDEPASAWQRARDWLASAFRPRNAVLLGAAVAAIVMFALWRGGDLPGPDQAPEQAIARDDDGAHRLDRAPDNRPDSRPEVDWNAVDDILAESAEEDDGDVEGGDDGDGDEAALEYAVGGGLELFAEPDYESWLDDLSAEELDALDALLKDTQAG
jgi:hypothetical protein